MKKVLLFLFLLIVSEYMPAQRIELKGSYQGANVYIQNPYGKDGKSFCTQKVLINGNEYAFKKESAFVIQLDSLGFQLGDTIKIELFHQPDCKPKVLQHTETLKSLFRIDSIAVSAEGEIYWRTKDETGRIGYTVEQFRWNKWIKVAEHDPKGAGNHEYKSSVPLHSGKNQFRVKQWSIFGVLNLSKTITIANPESKIEFKPQHLTMSGGPIEFSRETLFEIYNQYGDIVMKGKAKSVDCSKLPRGSYFINYDNEMGEFNKY